MRIDVEPRSIPSSQIPDWSREKVGVFEWQPGRKLLKCIRDWDRLHSRNRVVVKLLKGIIVVRHRVWSAVSGADIPLNSKIGGGLLLPHPTGVVIHPDALIGPNCLIMQGVTIGLNPGGVPMLGGHVDVGPGARLLGQISIGSHAIIGANAVVLRDVPDNTIVVGVPAKAIGVAYEIPVAMLS